MEPRLEEINKLLISYSQGEFDYKIEPSEKFDEIDAFISNINMLGEELKASTISKNYFNNIFNSVSDMLFVLSNKGIILSANRVAINKLHRSEEELTKYHVDSIAKENHHSFNHAKTELEKNSPVISFDSQFISADKESIPVSCSCSYLYNQNKERIGYLLIARDQSIIRKYEQSLMDSEVKYRNLFEKSSDCLFIIDPFGKILEINDAGITLLKIPRELLDVRNVFELIHDNKERELFQKELHKNNFIIDYTLKIKDYNDGVINCLVSVSKTYSQSGELIQYQGILKDMSRQREIENILIRTVLDTQESERKRIAKDLHDSLGQKLSGIKFHIEALKAMQKSAKNDKYDAILTRSNDMLNDAMVELSNISFNMMPGTLQNFGLSYAIKEICTKLRLDSEMLFVVDIEDDFPKVDKALEITIYRIIQEFINNAIKHGQATKISIKMNKDSVPNHIYLSLQDNGKGFEITGINQYAGMGLRNMKSRVESYNGVLKMSSALGQGTSYEILIPLNYQLTKRS